MNAQIHATLEPDGILLAVIDMPGKTMNVFSVELMDALDALMDRVERDPFVQSVVLTSGKPSFLAGADLVMVRGYTDAASTASPEAMFEMCGRLGRQFVRLEASAKPWVAAVNGIALGGGMELALACRSRLVTSDSRAQLGLPEVRWGLLPGAGGTQRLPRLAGFEVAADMLLSGRSITPLDAVRLGLFARAVPPDRLLDEARGVALSLHGKAYDAAAKFPHLMQSDVPAYSASAVRAIAARNGVSDQDFADYPAYSAIIDSVLKGARLPMADATAAEMRQFLRLMFNPVAGNMVGTLFLERLRAERELAAPPNVRIGSIGVGAISAGRNAWADDLIKLRLAQEKDAKLPADTLELIDQNGARHRISLRVLADAPEAADAIPCAILAPSGPYGRVLEVVAARGTTVPAASAFAALLRCLPWHTPGPVSVLQSLRGQSSERQHQLARAYAAQPDAGDPAFMDVAACLAGVTPAWSGGPFASLTPSIRKGDSPC